MQKLRLTKNEVCHILSIKADKLAKLIQTDVSFPRPIKEGVTRQASVYFDRQDLENWWCNKKSANDPNAVLSA
ncbi:AlpA family transcriptional regulator [Acinetobacter sp. ANC 3832]|uniref:AlpA family transcriptional regulator n=1 Tax=Acinetobacter sp. ANC 3832 TaxID=1977874 RepID=UPI000A333007|nr:AlpA family transcriptional regulator [Acinetobacter sp. ANC 3832]OTG92609.1 AlpA family transcriptional regulator [Acinetobacter sp. ANC 3832]